MVSIMCETPDPVVTYTTDGSEPTIHSETFTAPFVFTEGGTVKAKAFINKGNQSSETISAGFDVAPAKWIVVSTSSEIKGSEGSKAIDSDPTTSWRTNRKGGTYPHEIIIDLGEELGLKGFSYTPSQEESISGTIYQFNFYVSEDGENWKKIIDNGLSRILKIIQSNRK